MKTKYLIWVFIIGAGVFLGMFAYEKFTEYRLSAALESELAEMQSLMEGQKKAQLKAKQEAEEKRRIAQAKKAYKNTACAMNEDTNTCHCINESTGARIQLSFNDCKKRAKEISW